MSDPHLLQSAPARPQLRSATAPDKLRELVQRGAECRRFAGGEWLINESWRELAPESPQRSRQRQRLYFQHSAAAPCEAMGEIGADDAGAAAPPLLFRSGERCAIVLGRTVFQRWPRQQGLYWYRVTTQPFGAAAFFLRSYLRQRNADACDHGLNLPEAPYAFGHLDLERNVLVTCRQQADPRFPLFLVYSAADYGLAWQFDQERTRRVNSIR